jgi:hypothetical protein
MATRFYLPSSGTPPLSSLAKDSAWELETGLVRLPTVTEKSNTALATSTRTWPATTTQQWCWYQFQSEPLLTALSWTTAEAVSMVIGKLAETTTSGDSHLVYSVRVVSNDGSTVRGTIGLYHATSTELALMASAATRIHSARVTGATNFNSQVGDRIIIEIGLHGVTPALEAIQMRIGDPTATDNFALTAALTTDLVSWVLLTQNVPTCILAETVSNIDTVNALLISAANISETTSSISIEDAITVAVATLSEIGTLLETIDAIVDSPTSLISEITTAAEMLSASVITSASIAESGSALDIKQATSNLIASLSETVSAIETIIAGLSINVSQSEPTVAVSVETASGILISASSEASSALDSISSLTLFNCDLLEIASAIDENIGSLDFYASIIEDASLNDLLIASMLYTMSIIEAAGGSTSGKYWSGTEWKNLANPTLY